MKVRIKDNDKKCPGIQLGQTIIFHGTEWIDVEEKYRNKVEKDIRLEVLKEKKVIIQDIIQDKKEDVKVEVKKEVEPKEEIKQDIKTIEDKQESIANIFNSHWTNAKKNIGAINDVEFLQNDLLPELEKANKSVLIEACKNRIQELNNT
jgi:hypothetical protein